MSRRFAVVATAVVVVLGGGSLAWSATASKTATCTPSPVITSGTTSDSFSVRCSVPRSTTTVTATTTVTQTVTASPSSTTPPVTTTSTTSAPTSASPTSDPTSASPTSPSGGTLALPVDPYWAGGNGYYAQFPGASVFKDPSFFPHGAFYADGDPAKIVAVSGINYVERNNADNSFPQYAAAKLAVIQAATGDPNNLMKGSDFSSPYWAGTWLSDELDGSTDPASGHAEQRQNQQASQAGVCSTYRPPANAATDSGVPCKFERTNYTGIVTSAQNDTQIKADEFYVNMVKGAVSVDGYYASDKSCPAAGTGSKTANNRGDYQVNASADFYCDSAFNYGNFIDNLRARDIVANPDGSKATYQPKYVFVELAGTDSGSKTITAEKVKGAVMAGITHGADGVDYFDVGFGGACGGGELIPQVANGSTRCADTVAAVKSVNGLLDQLATVLNTASYVYDFGDPRAYTMLKAKDGFAYVFTSPQRNQDPGTYTLTLPSGITGTTATDLSSGATLPVTGGKLTDSFSTLYGWHVYKIAL